MTHKKTDHYLLNSLVTGDKKGVLEIYKKLYPNVLGYIRKHNGTEDHAKEIFHKGLLQLLTRSKAKDFEIKSTFEGYFLTICKNLWRRENKMAKNEVTNEKVIHLTSETREIALSTLEQEKWELFQEKLKEISENCQKILNYFFKKISYIDIASTLGYTSENVVRQRVFKCKSSLAKLIQNDPRYNELREL